MKYQLFFEFFETEQQASDFCEKRNEESTPYMRKKHPAHYTPWSSESESDKMKFIAWYYR